MFTYTSTGWALWNMQLGALMQGASIVLYEGSPGTRRARCGRSRRAPEPT